MEWTNFLSSIALVAFGAAITLVTDAIRRSADARRAREDREEMRAATLRAEGLKHAEQLYQNLSELIDAGARYTVDGLLTLGDQDQIERLSSATYRLFPLLPDKQIRDLVEIGMWGVSNYMSLDEFDPDDSRKGQHNEIKQRQLMYLTRGVTAAYLRGERPDTKAVDKLNALDAYLTMTFRIGYE